MLAVAYANLVSLSAAACARRRGDRV